MQLIVILAQRGNLDAANLYIRTRTHGTPKNNIIAYGTGNVTFEAGNLGIGHSGPTELLHVQQSTGDVNAIVESVAAGTTPTLHIKAPADRLGVITFHEGAAFQNSIFSGTDDSLNFYTNSGNDAVLPVQSDKSIRMYGDVQIDGVLDKD